MIGIAGSVRTKGQVPRVQVLNGLLQALSSRSHVTRVRDGHLCDSGQLC